MSFDKHIQELENEYKFLQSHIAVTDENWRDFVKEKFFSEHLDQITNEYNDFNSELNNLNKAFDYAENTIQSLR